MLHNGSINVSFPSRYNWISCMIHSPTSHQTTARDSGSSGHIQWIPIVDFIFIMECGAVDFAIDWIPLRLKVDIICFAKRRNSINSMCSFVCSKSIQILTDSWICPRCSNYIRWFIKYRQIIGIFFTPIDQQVWYSESFDITPRINGISTSLMNKWHDSHIYCDIRIIFWFGFCMMLNIDAKNQNELPKQRKITHSVCVWNKLFWSELNKCSKRRRHLQFGVVEASKFWHIGTWKYKIIPIGIPLKCMPLRSETNEWQTTKMSSILFLENWMNEWVLWTVQCFFSRMLSLCWCLS